MLCYNRNDISEGIDISKTSASKVCDIWQYWYFLDIRFKFQLYVCTGFHDICLLIAILSINSADYRCITNRITKKDAANIFQHADLTEKRGAL